MKYSQAGVLFWIEVSSVLLPLWRHLYRRLGHTASGLTFMASAADPPARWDFLRAFDARTGKLL